MQQQKPLLSESGFAVDALSAPGDALAAFFECVAIARPGIETIARDDARGRVLATQVVAAEDHPASARSAMDGFAIVASDAPGTFAIAGSVAMGRAPERPIERRRAIRIPTGGVLPSGADAVVPIEATRVTGESVEVAQAIAPGENVVPRGADVRANERLLAPETVLGPAHIGLLASLGFERIDVYRRPLVGVVSSGDEIVPPAQSPGPGQVRDSNRYAIGAALTAMGARVKHYPTVSDREGALADALRAILDECDAVVASGGSSVGTHDRLPEAVARLDPGIIVHGLRIKPGKPALLGARGVKPIVGLPGNPGSALFVLEAVAAPIVAALSRLPSRASVEALRLTASVRGRPGWTTYVPVEIDGSSARPLEIRSFSASMAARADGYLIVGPDDDELRAGECANVRRFLT